jgi:hypothetical protein
MSAALHIRFTVRIGYGFYINHVDNNNQCFSSIYASRTEIWVPLIRPSTNMESKPATEDFFHTKCSFWTHS